jgi:hypothetical protein
MGGTCRRVTPIWIAREMVRFVRHRQNPRRSIRSWRCASVSLFSSS